MTKEKFLCGLNACAVTYHNGQKLYEHDELVKCLEDLGMFEQEPFMNKPCVAHQVCHEDKVKVLNKIRAEIAEYGSIFVAYVITDKTKTDKGIEKLVSDVLKQAKEQVLNVIDKHIKEYKE